jgi:hypothetical protein
VRSADNEVEVNPLQKFLSYGPEPPSLEKQDTRQRLADAIVAGDSSTFRAVLLEQCPELCQDRRWFGVLVPTPKGMSATLVDATGRKAGEADVLEPSTPIHILNLKRTSTGFEMTYGGEVWSLPDERSSS